MFLFYKDHTISFPLPLACHMCPPGNASPGPLTHVLSKFREQLFVARGVIMVEHIMFAGCTVLGGFAQQIGVRRSGHIPVRPCLPSVPHNKHVCLVFVELFLQHVRFPAVIGSYLHQICLPAFALDCASASNHCSSSMIRLLRGVLPSVPRHVCVVCLDGINTGAKAKDCEIRGSQLHHYLFVSLAIPIFYPLFQPPTSPSLPSINVSLVVTQEWLPCSCAPLTFMLSFPS